MKYLFIGDTHGHQDLRGLQDTLPALNLTARDALIHCGDWGAPWIHDMDDTLLWWQQLPLKKVICLGNHENYGWIQKQPLVRRWGARGFDLGGGLFAPLAGEVAVIGGRSFWFYPGGLSIDFFLRTPGRTVFPEELLETQAAESALENLKRRAPVDFIVSHDAPRGHVGRRFGFNIGPPPSSWYRHLGLEEGSRAHPGFVLERVPPGSFRRWYFGHHHRDDEADGLSGLWRRMALEDSVTGERTFIPDAD